MIIDPVAVTIAVAILFAVVVLLMWDSEDDG